MSADRLRALTEGPALDLPAITWEAPEVVVHRRDGSDWYARWGGPVAPHGVHLDPYGTQHLTGPLIHMLGERLTLDQAEQLLPWLASAVAMGREMEATR